MNSHLGKYIKNLLSLPSVYLFLLQRVTRQKRFIRLHLLKELYPFRIKNDGSLSKEDFSKITSYYAMGVPGVLGESLCILRGCAMKPRERLCLSLLGGISGLLDDLFDDPDKDADHLEEFIMEPETMEPANTHEKLLLHFYRLGLHYSYHPNLIQKQAEKVFHTQQQSIQQQQAGDEAGRIEEVTFLKGGASFIYYRLCLEHDLSKAEENLLYHLGGLMQMGNDIFDVWEDHGAGISTIATRCRNIKELRENFSNKYAETFRLAYNTPYRKKNIRQFLQISSLALGRVFVCLDQFEKLQATTNNEFQLRSYSRKQLICDMQKPKNQWKAINYFLIMNS